VTILTMLLFLVGNELFVVDASANASYIVPQSREALRTYVDDIGLFARNMPGVVDVKPLGDETFLYRTEKDLPLSGAMRANFVIRKNLVGDSVTVYTSPDRDEVNYMSCHVLLRPFDEETTTIQIQLRVRLSQENASDVHWLAPILGEDFISRQMVKDLNELSAVFIRKSNEELISRLAPATVSK
jgi:hypothetical protein